MTRITFALTLILSLALAAAHAQTNTAPDGVEAIISSWGKQHPIGRVIKMEEVANLVLFMCSDDASAMTGGSYLIDGGLMAKIPLPLPD